VQSAVRGGVLGGGGVGVVWLVAAAVGVALPGVQPRLPGADRQAGGGARARSHALRLAGRRREWIDWTNRVIDVQGQLRWPRGASEPIIVGCKNESERLLPLPLCFVLQLGRRRQASGWVWLDPDTGKSWREMAPDKRFMRDAYTAAPARARAAQAQARRLEARGGPRQGGSSGTRTVLDDLWSGWVDERFAERRSNANGEETKTSSNPGSTLDCKVPQGPSGDAGVTKFREHRF
jgi:hypothetical protein